MSYRIKEIFYTLQGEGLNAGRPSVFCRFSGCNLWSGRVQDREKAICTFCDTDFNGVDGESGGEYQDAVEVAEIIVGKWPAPLRANFSQRPLLVFTGGEPLLQLDETLIAEVKSRGFEVAVETNGTIRVPVSVDWITVSPKSLDHLVQRSGNELKLIYPQKIQPAEVIGLEFDHYILSPRADLNPAITAKNTELALAFCKSNPGWRLSLQLHKILNIP